MDTSCSGSVVCGAPVATFISSLLQSVSNTYRLLYPCRRPQLKIAKLTAAFVQAALAVEPASPAFVAAELTPAPLAECTLASTSAG